MEVESTIRPAKDRIAGFEGREGHRTPFASAKKYRGEAVRVKIKRRRAGNREFGALNPEVDPPRLSEGGLLGADQGGDEIVQSGASADLVIEVG